MNEIDRRPDNDERWHQAYLALVQHGDQRPLAELFSGTAPIPPSIREHIGRMLNPATDPGDADRLMFSRSPRLARKMKRNQDRIAIGLEYLTLRAAKKPRNVAMGKLTKAYGVSESYIDHSITLAQNLPSYFRDFARENPPVWGLNARKKTVRKAK